MKMPESKEKYQIKSRIWILTAEGTFLGEGRIQLLEAIRETGSISEAAKRMKMSYKKAWFLVNSMNRQCSEPVVERKIGGKNGGGSTISETGEKLIRLFTHINESAQQHLKMELEKALSIN